MAEGLFRRMIAERPDLRVLSAGVSTYPGQPPSAHAVEVLAELGVDISQHRSRPLSEKVIDEADWIIAMTRSHLDSIIYLFPRAAEKVYLLREFEPGATSLDVADPIGMGLEAYRAARDIILNGLPGLMQFIDQDRSAAFSIMNRNPHNRSLEEVDPEIFHAIEADENRHGENDLRRKAVFALNIAVDEEIEFLLGGTEFDVGLERNSVVGGKQRVKKFVDGNGLIVFEA